jgi:hypothetical protein
MLSWHIGSRMLTCIVKSEPAMLQLRDELRRGAWRDAPICPFVCLNYLYQSNSEAMTVDDALDRYAVRNEPEAATRRKAAWLRAACADTDPPLRMYLPHIDGVRDAASGRGGRRPGFVPEGLIGHGLNLVRPKPPTQRRTLWMALIGDVLVFDTVQNAGSYRKWCVKQGVRCPTLLSLDCERIQNSGITEGGKPPPQRLTDMDAYFGTMPRGESPPDEGGNGATETAQVTALRQLLVEWDEWQSKQQEQNAACEEVQRMGVSDEPDAGARKGKGPARRAVNANADDENAVQGNDGAGRAALRDKTGKRGSGAAEAPPVKKSRR